MQRPSTSEKRALLSVNISPPTQHSSSTRRIDAQCRAGQVLNCFSLYLQDLCHTLLEDSENKRLIMGLKLQNLSRPGCGVSPGEVEAASASLAQRMAQEEV